MGSIISAHCDCGYVVEMPLGGGMRSFNECSNFPFFCEECRSPFIETYLQVDILVQSAKIQKCFHMETRSHA